MTLIADLTAALGAAHVITGADLARYTADVTHHYHADPIAAVRPADTAEVAQVMQIAARHGVAVLPASGRTGLTGGLMTVGGLILSVERLNTIRQINPAARLAIVEAGVVLDSLHKAAEAEDLYFPLWFGARGSAMIGGVLSTNAGGSNVLRYGSTRALCLGLEVVLADGRILNLMSALHKDNSGYDLKQLFIGAEGTLGVITAAVMKLVPRPRAYATATLSARSLPDALILLNRLQAASGGAVEAFEYMPASYMAQMARARPDIRQPFSPAAEVTILVELGSLRPDDTTPMADGSLPLTGLLETTLAQMMAEGMVQDAEIAQTEAQRAAMWQRRELASEVMTSRQPTIDTDICLPTDLVAPFLDRISARLPQLDAGAETILVAHLGDGNVHFTVYPSDPSAAHADRIIEAVEDEVQALGGSFSAEHGVGLSKLASMKRRKDPVALDVMRAIKAALDPDNRMNPGKVIPAP
ncbi:FAD-binding oxidoreductase [Cypionkella sp.]|uniref:FAD-binding oxidoreductase n=1 Tax=Cypionkella sp. TaxID=2811411 RepID=UPI002FDD6927